MAADFDCEFCRQRISLPENPGGRREKCPHCGKHVYVPKTGNEEIPLAEDDLPDLLAERQQQQAIRAHMNFVSAAGPAVEFVPLEHRENLTTEDLHHFVVNFCLDQADMNRHRAELHVASLRKFGDLGLAAVDDFISGKIVEPAMKHISKNMLTAMLKQLREKLV